MIIEDQSSEGDTLLPDLAETYDSEWKVEEGEKDTYLLRNRRLIMQKEKPARRTRDKAIFSLEDKNGNMKEYLELLDMGSTGGLISKNLVEKYGFQYEKSSSWDTNVGNFKRREITNIKCLRFPQFTNKREIGNKFLYINPNVKQRYKVIFGLDLLIENKFDFLLNMNTINW